MNLKHVLAALAGIAGLGALAYARRIEPGVVDVKPLRLALKRLDPAFDGFRIVHIGDIHWGRWMDGARLATIIALVNAQGPDLVAITGDFVSEFGSYDSAALAAALRGLRSREATVAVLGNHDYWGPRGADPVRRLLSNAVCTLRRGDAALHIAGVDDVVFQRARLDRVLAALPADGAAILLAHEPDFADISAATGRFDLQLSGHSHGGQVRLPWLGAPILPKHGHRYPDGLYWVNGMLQHTTRGLGVANLPVRFNCRPEIAVITLRARLRKPRL